MFIFLGKNFVMRRKRVLVTCPRFTESEEVQVSYVGGRGMEVWGMRLFGIWFYIISHWHLLFLRLEFLTDGCYNS